MFFKISLDKQGTDLLTGKYQAVEKAQIEQSLYFTRDAAIPKFKAAWSLYFTRMVVLAILNSIIQFDSAFRAIIDNLHAKLQSVSTFSAYFCVF